MTINWPAPGTLKQLRVVRNEPRVMVRVVVEPMSTSIGGHLAKKGESFHVIYKSDLPRVQAMLQTDKHRELLAMATEMWNEAFAEHAKAYATKEEALRTMGESVESFYYKLPGGKLGRPPLLALDIGPDVAAPHTPEAAAEQSGQGIADAIARAIEMATRGQRKAG